MVMKTLISLAVCSSSIVIWLSCQVFAQDAGGTQPDANRFVSKEYLDKELENIKKRQDIVLESVSESFNRSLIIFGALVSAVTLFTFYQAVKDNRIMKLLQSQIDEGRDITNSYQKNIDSITSLVGALREVFEFQAKAQEIIKHISDLETASKEGSKHWDNEIAELNKHGIEVSLKCRRNSYNITSFQHLTSEFRDRYKYINGSTDTKNKLNANCFYIIALDYRILNDYFQSLEHFKKAISIAEEHKQMKPEPLDLYPSLPPGKNLSDWLTKLQNVSVYHSAIILYNLGRYDEALKGFETALTYDPYDYKSLTYIPEAMYLGRLASFNKIEAKFNEVIKKLRDLKPQDTGNFAETREQLLAQTFMRMGNCYMGTSRDEEFRKYKNPSMAEEYFRQATKLDPESMIMKFSLAQVLYMRRQGSQSMSRGSIGQYSDMFSDVFQKIKSKLGLITETKILVMYYYILAICCFYGEIENETPQFYITRIYELRPHLPSYDGLRIFSPRTKNDLITEEFFKDVEDFQEDIVKSTAKTSSGLVSRPLTR